MSTTDLGRRCTLPDAANTPDKVTRLNLEHEISVDIDMDRVNRPGIVRSFSFLFCALSAATLIYATGFRYVRKLPAETFQNDFMFWEALLTPWGIAVAVVATITLFSAWSLKWAELDGWKSLRWVVATNIIIMTWSFSSYSINFYSGLQHGWDRALLLLLGVATLWRPRFIGLFLMQLGVIMAHLGDPLSYSWTDKSLSIDLLLLIQLAVVARRRIAVKEEHLLASILFVIAVHYVRPAVGKVALGWLWCDDLSNLFVGSYHQNSWPPGMSESLVFCYAESISTVGLLIKFLTLVVEFAPLFFLTGPRFVCWSLTLAIAMHLGIFVSSGIFFWKWILVDVMLVWAFSHLTPEMKVRLFSMQTSVTFAVVVLSGCFFYQSAPILAWYDSPMYDRFSVRVIEDSGSVYQVSASQMAPFDLQFSQGRFWFADREPRLINCLGSCFDRDRLIAVQQIQTLEDLKAVRQRFGEQMFDASEKERLGDLLIRFVRRNPDSGCATLLKMIPKPPQHIWAYPDQRQPFKTWNWEEPVDRVQLLRTTGIRTSDGLNVLEETLLIDRNCL